MKKSAILLSLSLLGLQLNGYAQESHIGPKSLTMDIAYSSAELEQIDVEYEACKWGCSTGVVTVSPNDLASINVDCKFCYDVTLRIKSVRAKIGGETARFFDCFATVDIDGHSGTFFIKDTRNDLNVAFVCQSAYVG